MPRRKKGKTKSRFSMTQLSRYAPNGMRVLNNLFYVRFYSADRFPWYQGSAFVKDIHEARERFVSFVENVRTYEKQRTAS